MDILFAKERATAAEVMAAMPDAPGYSAVRSHLTTLEQKGYVRHEKDGAKYVFIPTLNTKKARMSAIGHLLRTFFGGSRSQAVATLLDVSPSEYTKEELDNLAELIEKARRGRKQP
jgi:predicted transcriptional regulator